MKRVSDEGNLACRGRLSRHLLGVMLVLSLTLAASACRHSHVPGTAGTDAVLDGFKGAGFDVAQVKVVEPDAWTADHCASGIVADLDVLICEFKTEQALASGEAEVQHGWDTVNVDTGVVLHNGRTMLAVSDRASRDPSGRAIARMLNAFRALP